MFRSRIYFAFSSCFYLIFLISFVFAPYFCSSGTRWRLDVCHRVPVSGEWTSFGWGKFYWGTWGIIGKTVLFQSKIILFLNLLILERNRGAAAPIGVSNHLNFLQQVVDDFFWNPKARPTKIVVVTLPIGPGRLFDFWPPSDKYISCLTNNFTVNEVDLGFAALRLLMVKLQTQEIEILSVLCSTIVYTRDFRWSTATVFIILKQKEFNE